MSNRIGRQVLAFSRFALVAAIGLSTASEALAQDGSPGLRRTLLNTTLVQADAVTRMRETAVLGVWSHGLRAGRPTSEVAETVARFRDDFDTQVNRAGGTLDEKRYSDALYGMFVTSLKTVVPTRWLGATTGTVIDQVAALGKGPYDHELHAEQIDSARQFVDEAYRGVSFLQPKAVGQFVSTLDGADVQTRGRICEDLGSQRSGLGASFCASDNELVNQIDARGGSAGTLRELAAVEARIEQRIAEGTYTDEERASDKAMLLDLLDGSLQQNTAQVEEYVGDLTEALDDFERNADERFDNVFEELGEVADAVDTLLFNELEREIAEEERLRKEQAEARRRGQADDAFATGQLIATLIGEIDPKAGRVAQSLVSNGRGVFEAFEKFGDKSFGDIGTAALTADLVGVGLALFAAFNDADVPSPEQQILAQLERIEAQLEEISDQIARIDLKLDRVLDVLIEGFDRLQLGQSVIIADVSRNARLVLDTQSIVREEGNRLSDLIRGIAYGPCILSMRNRQTLSDERYRECAYLLRGEAVERMYVDEVELRQEIGSYRNVLLGEETRGRQTEALYEEFLERTATADSRRLASFERWYSASSYFAQFLAYSPSQARMAFPDGDFGLARIAANGDLLAEFRARAASQFLKPGGPDASRISPLLRSLSDATAAATMGIRDAKTRIAGNYGGQRNAPEGWLRPWGELPQERRNGQPQQEFVRAIPTVDSRLAQATISLLSGQHPPYWKAVHGGVAIFETELVFRKSVIDGGTSCGFLRTCYRALYDEWEAKVYLSRRPAGTNQVDVPTRTYIGNQIFRITEGDPGIGTGPFSPLVPKLCQSQACFGSAIVGQASAARRTPYSTALLEGYRQLHLARLAEVGRMLGSEIADGRAPELDGIDESIVRESTYVAALMRFALGGLTVRNDAIHSIASLDYEVRPPNALAIELTDGSDLLELDRYFQQQATRLFRLSGTRDLHQLGESARGGIEIRETTEGFRQLGRALAEDEAPRGLIAPSGAVDRRPAFSWYAIPGMTWYQMWIDNELTEGDSRDNIFLKWYSASVAGCNAGDVCTVDAPKTLGGERVSWWIRPWNATDGYGSWSLPLRFSTDAAPTPATAKLVAPAGANAGATPEFSWLAANGATWYWLWIQDSSGNGPTARWYRAAEAGCEGGGTCRVASPGTVAGNTNWWLLTYASDGQSEVYGRWSASQNFQP